MVYKYRKNTFVGSDAELKDVTELDCSFCNLTSFEGLNAPNLTILDCSFCNLTSFEGLNAPNLTILRCSNNQITSFEHLHCPNLATLMCFDNQITSFEYLHCPNLRQLSGSHNRLTSFEYLHCPNLTILWCVNNRITSFEHLDCLHLTELWCHQNRITSFEYLHCPNLTKLSCYDNQITSFEHLHCLHLTQLWCTYNQIASFEHLHCANLTKLWCHHNRITSFEHLHCPNLTELYCYNNVFEYIPPHITRILNGTKRTQNVYNDRQNVHNHAIQESVRQSITRIMCKKPNPSIENVVESILCDSDLTEQTKAILVEYSNDTSVHSTLNITFQDLLLHTYSRILCNADAKEIKRILGESMLDSVCKCFTGRISRLIDCLNGFDELVNINISDTEQIGQVISQIAINLESKKEYTVEKHKEYAMQELLERGYTKETIEEWIQHIE